MSPPLSGRSGGAFSFLFAKVSNFIQKAIVFWGTGVTSSANTFVTICFTERYTEASPGPYSLPRPLRREGSAYAHTRDEGWALYLIVFCKILANLHIPSFRRGLGRHSPPFSGRLDGAPPLLSEGSGEAVEVGWGFLFPNHTITITKSQKGFSMCKKGSYII